jgi:aryl-alcohol dehydrogenase-like predicted oxidoreductase
MGVVGFGGYRISNKSEMHKAALVDALTSGLKLIDTSSNYTDGESEILIGEVLKNYPSFTPILVTKAGYIQGKNLQENTIEDEVVTISETLKHSIHPLFLENQLTLSLKRLQKNSIDVFLLHNPEYYFQLENSSIDEFYLRIKKAFEYLETEVKKGRIKSYGISSNNFILPHNDPEWVSFDRVLKIAREISMKHHFTHIQFPLNLIEIGALEKFGDYDELSLVEQARFNNIITMSNRPLNAFTNGQLIRLATYSHIVDKIDEEYSQNKFNEVMSIISNKWIEEQNKDNEGVTEGIEEVTLIKQFRNFWNQLPSQDSVDQVYFGHLFPFVAALWGGALTVEESQPFYELYEISSMHSRKTMNSKALTFREQALSVGLIKEIDQKDFAQEVIETYLNYGIDYVLVGMKNPEYVAQLKTFF